MVSGVKQQEFKLPIAQPPESHHTTDNSITNLNKYLQLLSSFPTCPCTLLQHFSNLTMIFINITIIILPYYYEQVSEKIHFNNDLFN